MHSLASDLGLGYQQALNKLVGCAISKKEVLVDIFSFSCLTQTFFYEEISILGSKLLLCSVWEYVVEVRTSNSRTSCPGSFWRISEGKDYFVMAVTSGTNITCLISLKFASRFDVSTSEDTNCNFFWSIFWFYYVIISNSKFLM